MKARRDVGRPNCQLCAGHCRCMTENNTPRDGETAEYRAVVDFLHSTTGAWVIRIAAVIALGLLIWQIFF